MLIDTYDLDVFTPPCDPGAVRYSAIATLHTDIAGALPYLNATLGGAVYNQAAPALSWRKAGHYLNFALKLAAAQVKLEHCPPLAEPAYAGRLAQLQALVIPAPAIS